MTVGRGPRRFAIGLLAVLMIHGAAGAAPRPATAIEGFWRTAQGAAVIHITADGDDFPGRIAWLAQPRYGASDPPDLRGQPIRDRHNPDAALRDRSLIGLRIVTHLHYHVTNDGQAEWVHGRIYDTKSGHTYRCYIRLADADHLKLRGYIGIRAFGHTTTWTRVADPAHPQAKDSQ